MSADMADPQGLHGLAFSHFSRRKLTMASLPWKKISRFLQMQSYKRFAQGPTSLSVRMLRVHAINLENRLVCQAKKVQRNLISSYPAHSGPFLTSVYAKLTFSGSRVFQASSAIWTFFSASATLVKGGRGGRTNLSPRHEQILFFVVASSHFDTHVTALLDTLILPLYTHFW